MNPNIANTLRTIRSFVVRGGRITPAQQYALDHFWGTYGLCLQKEPLDFKKHFGRDAPRIIEVGYGMGNTLLHHAKQYPEQDVIGIEVYPPAIGHMLHELQTLELNNVRLFKDDAVDVFKTCIPKNSITEVHIFFPDPWPKKRHHKRRLIQTEFIALIEQVLVDDGKLHIATDWQNYAEHIHHVMHSFEHFENHSDTVNNNRPLTKFEKRGIKKGHAIFEILYRKIR